MENINLGKSVKGLVSVIVPIYCISQEYLGCCLDSLVHQTYHNIEIILVDDGSPDQSGDVCDSYAEEYPIIKVIHQENQGVSVARNNGICASIGEYIMFVDPDDWLEDDCIEIAVKEIEHQNVNLLFFQYCRESSDETQLLDANTSQKYDRERLKRIQMMIIAGVGSLSYGYKTPWGKLIRKSVVAENNICFPVDLKRSEDVVFNLYLYEYVTEAYYLDFVGYHYRVYQESYTQSYNVELPQIMCNVLREYAKFVNTFHDDDVFFEKCLGIRTVVQANIIENHYTFHPNSKLTKNQILEIIDHYINNELVSKYLKYCKLKDFHGWKTKIYYLLLKGRFYNLYYAYNRLRHKG